MIDSTNILYDASQMKPAKLDAADLHRIEELLGNALDQLLEDHATTGVFV